MPSPGEVTRVLAELAKGDDGAQERLISLVYQELRRLAAAYMRKERPDHTLQATALVHEAFVRLVPQRMHWQNRAHFFGVAAQQMRRILLDHARKQKAAKRHAGQKLQLEEALVMAIEQPGELVDLDEALKRFTNDHERQSRVVELRFFGGRTEDEIAKMLGISVETVKRDWKFSKAWLAAELGPSKIR
jgi:RNA polymerase sigma factor (TIGR02999 family)